MDELIQRIRQYEEQAQDKAEIFPAVSQSAVHEAENKLGFALPQLLRQLYVEIGNGGFGPGYGILGLEDGADDEGKSIVELYHFDRMADPNDPFWAWPQGLLKICHWGCAIYSCVDCSNPDGPVIVFDPNKHEWQEDGTPQSWGSSFFVHMPSFSTWLEAWVEGVDLWTETSRRVDARDFL